MNFRHKTRDGRNIVLDLLKEENCYQVMNLINLDRILLRIAELSTDDAMRLLQKHNILIAHVGGQAVGVIVTAHRTADNILVRWLAVDETMRRKGVGAALLKSVSTGLSGKRYNLRAVVPEAAVSMQQLLKSHGVKAGFVEHGNISFG